MLLRPSLGGSRASPSSRGFEVLQDGDYATDVVRVWVADGDGIEVRDAARPEIFRDHVFAEIELRSSWGGISGVLSCRSVQNTANARMLAFIPETNQYVIRARALKVDASYPDQ